MSHSPPQRPSFHVGSPRLRLILCLHDHQPIGNFDGVFADAFRDSYEPFLSVFEPFDNLQASPCTLSGSLLEWLEDASPRVPAAGARSGGRRAN